MTKKEGDIPPKKRLINVIVSDNTKSENQRAVLELMGDLGFEDTKSATRAVRILQHQTYGSVRIPEKDRLTRMDLNSVRMILYLRR